MKSKPFYVVLDLDSRGLLGSRGLPNARRMSKSWPALDPGEIVVRVAIDVPDDIFEHPVHVAVIPADEILIAVSAEPLDGEQERKWPKVTTSETDPNTANPSGQSDVRPLDGENETEKP